MTINKLEVYRDFIIKRYNPIGANYSLSSIDNELFCIKKFSDNNHNQYCPNVLRMDDTSYMIQKYSFDIGSEKGIDSQKVRRLFFSITYDEFEKQMDEILMWLSRLNMRHRDIHPGNLLFSESEKRFKLIDFYFSQIYGINVEIPNSLNDRYSIDDHTAIEKLKKEVKAIYDSTVNDCNDIIFPIFDKIGVEKFDGSSVSKGVLYHDIDIPILNKQKCVVHLPILLSSILNNTTFNPKSVIDIGCAEGLYSYNILRKFSPDIVYMYEADPYVNLYLTKTKEIFNIKEMNVRSKIASVDDLQEAELVLMLNVHMWLYKNLGKEITEQITKRLIQSCKEMFFLTAGIESGGMFTLKDLEFSSREHMKTYLKKLGAKNVYYIEKIPIHGGVRHLFKISNI
jgi:serine/threonine protein kinase